MIIYKRIFNKIYNIEKHDKIIYEKTHNGTVNGCVEILQKYLRHFLKKSYIYCRYKISNA